MTTIKTYRYTIDDILALRPCDRYDRTRLTALFAGRTTVTARDIADAEDVPAADRRWLMAMLLDRRQRIMWACECATAVLPLLADREYAYAAASNAISAALAAAAEDTAEYRAAAYAAAAYADAAGAAAYAAAYAAYAGAAAYAAAYAAYAGAAAYAYAAYAATDAAAYARVTTWCLRVAAHYLGGEWPGDAP